jgi:histidinol-phosphatase (PHP family)
VRLPDYHTHTVRCGHAVGFPSEYVAMAKAQHLKSIGIADHLPLLPEPDAEISMGVADLPGYVNEVQGLQLSFPGYVLLGIEADYRPDTVSEVAALLEEYPFDYTIGSVHHLGAWSFDDPRQMDGYAQRDIDEVWIEYFDLVGEAAESGLFTILGHLDLMKKFGYRATRVLDLELDHLVDRIARAHVLVEINTAGLHKPVKEAYPTLEILRRLYAAGVGITFGSDAHRPTEVGRDFAHATALARDAGYEEFAFLEASPSRERARVRFGRFDEPATPGPDAEPAGRPPRGAEPADGASKARPS